MEPTILARLFGLSNSVLEMNLAGVSHEESLVRPAGTGNSINWVLGHILVSRNAVLSLLGIDRIWSDGQSDPYRRGSPGEIEADWVAPIESMKADLQRCQASMTRRFGELTAQDLDRPAPAPPGGGQTETIGDRLLFLHFHETYHAGQIGLLRRLSGHPGAVR